MPFGQVSVTPCVATGPTPIPRLFRSVLRICTVPPPLSPATSSDGNTHDPSPSHPNADLDSPMSEVEAPVEPRRSAVAAAHSCLSYLSSFFLFFSRSSPPITRREIRLRRWKATKKTVVSSIFLFPSPTSTSSFPFFSRLRLLVWCCCCNKLFSPRGLGF